MAALATDLRRRLEAAVIEARKVSERAASAAVQTLAVAEAKPYDTLTETQRRLRNMLRARARQLGGGVMSDGIQPLVEEIAYEQWHQMLFARFLAENDLLMHPAGVAVTLEECEELAPEEGEPDGWAVAAKYAARMLPGIFRVDDPATQVAFAPESRGRLEALLVDLPRAVFTADDSLGWVYQFWQTEKKNEVNASGRKIGGADLPPVTQLFTENYMVRFLLENSLGAWWAARHPQSPLLGEFDYLRFKDDGTPAAGTFPGWPETAAKVTVMDPCCGSGHFLVEAFDMLTKMRMEEEGLDQRAAGDAVLRDNLFGLELDPRCTQIAAFAVAFAAWKAGGYREIPIPNIACSGIPVKGQLEEWKKLAAGDFRLEEALDRLYYLYRNASDLGSLIDPSNVELKGRLFAADYRQVAPLIEQQLSDGQHSDPTTSVFGSAAAGTSRANALLSRTYSLVATNVPYLARSKQSKELMSFAARFHDDSKRDLATVFISRCLSFLEKGGSLAVVSPQNWLSLTTYMAFRERLLKSVSWNKIALLDSGAFGAITGEVVKNSLIVMSASEPRHHEAFVSIDASLGDTPSAKAELLLTSPLILLNQKELLTNPDARIMLRKFASGPLLNSVANAWQGVKSSDDPRFVRTFWEIPTVGTGWEYFQKSVNRTHLFGGREHVLFWEDGHGVLTTVCQKGASFRGSSAWGKHGIGVTTVGSLAVTLYTGDRFSSDISPIVPQSVSDLPAIWAYCQSPEFSENVRTLDSKIAVTNATLGKVPFDADKWHRIADEMVPLPEPYSNDPTQWLFKGRPDDSSEPLQVAVARLLGYRWPEQEADDLLRPADDDGIVTLPATGSERPASERLRELLAAAYGEAWSPAKLGELLEGVGYGNKGLHEWLMEGFFQQHCKLFHNRPFIWHIWDGRKDGFSALVNYHKLDGPRLERLIYSYLGDWITYQRAERDQGIAGADGRLVAALELQQKLEAIRSGEAPYDIYVRWKPTHEQPLGWNPDLNDGVRLNVRPFVQAGVLRRKFTVNWNKDRGKDPDGSDRINDIHLSLADKRAARERLAVHD